MVLYNALTNRLFVIELVREDFNTFYNAGNYKGMTSGDRMYVILYIGQQV